MTVNGATLGSALTINSGPTGAAPSGSLFDEFDPTLNTIDVPNSTINPSTGLPVLPSGTLVVESLSTNGDDPALHYNRFATVSDSIPAPTASIANKNSLTVQEGSTLSLSVNGASSLDSYAWDVSGQGLFGDAFGTNPSITWALLSSLGLNHVGTFPIALRVTNATGQQAIDTATLTITGVAPVVTLTPPAGPVYPGAVYALGLSASLPSGVALQQWTINWGDGSLLQTLPGNVSSASHFYSQAGTPTITATAYADSSPGDNTSKTLQATISADTRAPVASAGGPYTITEGNSLTLDATASTVSNAADQGKLSYQWTIGGSTNFAGSNTATPVVSYPELLQLLGTQAAGPVTLNNVVSVVVTNTADGVSSGSCFHQPDNQRRASCPEHRCRDAGCQRD